MINVGIVGGSGYTGGELIRLLLGHPGLTIDFVFSISRPHTSIVEHHSELLGQTNLKFTDQINSDVAVVFLCLGHGKSAPFLNEHPFSEETIIIDLSNDFRLEKDRLWNGREFVYGLPEVNTPKIEKAKAIANPGCFATALQLALLPLAKAGQLNDAVHINATTGSTGAGVGLSATSHFSWRQDNLSWYKPFTHQHLNEITETLADFGAPPALQFIPQRGAFTRGIFATLYTHYSGSLDEAMALYEGYYSPAPFTHLSAQPISLKQVVNTNNCVLHLHKHDDYLLITSALDNLIKGAAGQAIQNLNLIMGWEENLGLNLKASVF
ncbi:MAG: N-acetyl-gamma-glutamyl-phosphate reductase [Flavobacteriaceae bacterium]